METIVIGVLGGAAYALQGIFKNKYELSEKFELDPAQCISSVIVGGIIGAWLMAPFLIVLSKTGGLIVAGVLVIMYELWKFLKSK